jgi:hypothetical protein
MFILTTPVLAESSNFEATINMEPEITENQINLVLGFRGEEVMAVSETINYDSTKVTLLDIVSIDNFTLTKGEETIDGKWHTIKILADSEYSFTDTNYAICVFQVKDNFKKGNSSDMFLYNVEAVGPEKDKFRYRGDYLVLTRESNTEMYFSLEEINDWTKFSYFLKNYILIIAIIVIVIMVGMIFIILHLPSKRKKENRSNKVSSSIKEENYVYTPNEEQLKVDTKSVDEFANKQKVVDLNDAILISELQPFESNPSKENETTQPMSQAINVPFDPFNAKPEDNNNVVNNVQEINTPNNNQEVVLPVEKKEVNTNNEFRAPIYTVDISHGEDVEILDDNSNNNNNTNINGILLILAVSLISLFSINVSALDETSYRISDLRDCLVGLITCDSELDYSKDGSVDIVDIVYTRSTTNVNFEKLLNTDPGFKEIHGKSPNIVSNKSTTTTAVVIKSTTTTTKRTTTKGSSSNNSSSNNKTTTKKTTTAKTTTEKTTKTTTTKTTTTKSTTTKTTAGTYNVSLSATNGTISGDKTVSVTSGKSASFTVAPQTGYTYNSVTCSNGATYSYNKSTNILKISSIKADNDCTIVFNPRNDIKVAIKTTNGTPASKTYYAEYGGNLSVDIAPKDEAGYTYSSSSCTNGVSSSFDTSSNKLNLTNVTTDTTCTVTYTINKYTVTVIGPNGNTLDSTTAEYKQKYSGSFSLNINKPTVTCNGNKVTVSTNASGVSSFSTVITSNTTCYITG